MATRAKFRCDSVTDFGNDNKSYKFAAVKDDGTPENERYHKYSPNGTLELWVTNPAVTFIPGECYYLDFTPAPKD